MWSGKNHSFLSLLLIGISCLSNSICCQVSETCSERRTAVVAHNLSKYFISCRKTQGSCSKARKSCCKLAMVIHYEVCSRFDVIFENLIHVFFIQTVPFKGFETRDHRHNDRGLCFFAYFVDSE